MTAAPTPTKIKVLVVDDSALVRRMLCEAINRQTDMEVIAVAGDPFVARDRILALQPDVLTLDIEMPRMDGLTFLKRLMHHKPTPAIVVSSLAQSGSDSALEALRLGAIDVLGKPSGPNSLGELGVLLPEKIRAAYAARGRKWNTPTATSGDAVLTHRFRSGSLLAIGASTGGTQAIENVLTRLPANCPPVLIAQHMPPVFSASFARRLDSLCRLEVREARHGDALRPGLALVAPGNFHLRLERGPEGLRVAVTDGPRVHYQRPAVDVLFSSIAEASIPNVAAALLTGMGADGAAGLLRLRQTGAHTIAQDEASCVVFGMPKAAIDAGAAVCVWPLDAIASELISSVVI